jgi:hypothetical protein
MGRKMDFVAGRFGNDEFPLLPGIIFNKVFTMMLVPIAGRFFRHSAYE